MNRCGAKRPRKEKKAGAEVEVMDEEIWKELPEDLLELVIARLPIAPFSRFRSVCQKWNSLPKCPRFHQLWANFAPQKLPLFFAVSGLGDAEIGGVYDPEMKKWQPTAYPPPYQGCLPRAASAGGLVCYLDDRIASFRVGNYLTQTWKEFPVSSDWTRYSFYDALIGMVTLDQEHAHPSAGGYKIVWANWRNRSYGVIDSLKKNSAPSPSSPTTTTTTTTRGIPANIQVPSITSFRTVSIGTVVYFLSRKPDGIISYDVVSGAWEQLLIPTPPNSYCISLAEWGGRLLLVGRVRNENNPVCVWELETGRWREADIPRIPTSWCSVFGQNSVVLYLMGNRKLLVMNLQTKQLSRTFTYDVVTREWSKVPPFIPPDHKRGQSIIEGVGFFPCLSASP